VLLQDAHPLRIRAPDGQRPDAVANVQPLAARAELLDHADQLVAGRERRLRDTEVGAGAQHGIGERHARGQRLAADVAGAGAGDRVLDHLQNLGTAEVVYDHPLHPVAIVGLHRGPLSDSLTTFSPIAPGATSVVLTDIASVVWALSGRPPQDEDRPRF